MPLYPRAGNFSAWHSHRTNIQTTLKHFREGELYGIAGIRCNTKKIELWENHEAESTIKAMLQFSKQKHWRTENREMNLEDPRLNPIWSTLNCVILLVHFTSQGLYFLVNLGYRPRPGVLKIHLGDYEHKWGRASSFSLK